MSQQCGPANKKKLSKQDDVAGLDKGCTNPRHEPDSSDVAIIFTTYTPALHESTNRCLNFFWFSNEEKDASFLLNLFLVLHRFFLIHVTATLTTNAVHYFLLYQAD